MLAPVIMEAGKSSDLQSATGRPRRANGVLLAQRPAGLRLRKRHCFRLSLKAGITDVPAQGGHVGGVPSSSGEGQPSTDWMKPTHTGQGKVVSSAY